MRDLLRYYLQKGPAEKFWGKANSMWSYDAISVGVRFFGRIFSLNGDKNVAETNNMNSELSGKDKSLSLGNPFYIELFIPVS